MSAVVEQNLDVEFSTAFEQGWQVDGLESLWVEIERCALVAINAIGASITVPLEFINEEIATVAQDEVSLLDWKLWCGGEVIFAVGIDGEVDQTGAEQIVSGLNPGVANARLSVGNAGENREEIGWELDDGAVLHEDPAIAAELKFGGPVESAPGELLGDDNFEKVLEEVLKGLVEPKADSLTRGGAVMIGFDMRG